MDFSAGSKACSAALKHLLQHLLPAHKNLQLELAKPAAKVVTVVLKDAMANEASARSVAVNAVGVMAVAVAVAVARVEAKGANRVQKVVLKGAPMDGLKAANHVKTVAEKVVAASVANATRKARRARSAQPVTPLSALKVVANLVNRASRAKVVATAVNVVVVTVQSAAVNASSATPQSKTWHSPTRQLWPQRWVASRNRVQTHHKVSAASEVTVAVSVASAMAAVASAVTTALKATVMT